MLIVPKGLLMAMTGQAAKISTAPVDTPSQCSTGSRNRHGGRRSLGSHPIDREFDKLGYDIESQTSGTGKLRFLEVKGRVTGLQQLPSHAMKFFTPSTSRRTSSSQS